MSYLKNASQVLAHYCSQSPVLPVLPHNTLNHIDDVIALLSHLPLSIVEVPLREPTALTVVERLAEAKAKGYHQAIIAAATIIHPSQISEVKKMGADLLISPAFSDDLLQRAEASQLPLLPGAMTPAEVMNLAQLGASLIKFFPAEVYGGAAILKAYQPIFNEVKFVASGGINASNIATYRLSNVVAIAGSWLITEQDLVNKDWQAIHRKYESALAFLQE